MKKISRRHFIYCAFLSTCIPSQGMCFFDSLTNKTQNSNIKGKILKGDGPETLWKWSKEGFKYKKLKNKKVLCQICPNACLLAPGDRSICRSKVNIKGKLYTLAYGNPCAVNIDPVEKKPLYHFMPMSKVFSIATTGCNFRCLNCQNWEISQAKPEKVRHYDMFPDKVIENVKKYKSQAIAYTYSEAVTFYEYMVDIATLAKEENIKNLMISNGYINTPPLLELCKYLDAANINIKSFDDNIYKKLNGGRLEPVLNCFRTLHEKKIHFEMTNLIVPGYVDNKDMLKKMCHWILENLGPDHPLHFLRFFPKYKLDRLPPTPVSTMEAFRKIAMNEGIRYVYLGNVPNHEGNHTYCHHCKKLLIKRSGYFIPENHIKNNKCKFCNTLIPGVWR